MFKQSFSLYESEPPGTPEPGGRGEKAGKQLTKQKTYNTFQTFPQIFKVEIS